MFEKLNIGEFGVYIELNITGVYAVAMLSLKSLFAVVLSLLKISCHNLL